MPKIPPLDSFNLLGRPYDLHLLVHYLDYLNSYSSREDLPFGGFLYYHARDLERSLKEAQDPFTFLADQLRSRLDFAQWLDGKRPFDDDLL